METMVKFRNKYPPPPQRCPWLVFCNGKKRKPRQTFYSIPDGRSYVRNIPDMCAKYTCPCSHGWLLMLDFHSDDCFLLNPVSMAKINLPPWESSFCLHYCNMSLPPDDPNCIVVAFADHKPGPYVRFCRPGDNEWIDQELESKDHIFKFPQTCRGKIYGLVNINQNLAMLDFVGSSVHVRQVGVKLPDRSLPDCVRRASYLIESCQEVFVVSMLYLGNTMKIRDMEVIRMDFPRCKWVSVESLGDRAFFINASGYCTSCSASESGIKGNSIYFIAWEDMGLYKFDLEDKSMSVSLPCPGVRSPNWLETLWIMPNLSS